MPFLLPLLFGGSAYLAGFMHTSAGVEQAKVEQTQNTSTKWVFILGTAVVVAGATIYTVKKLKK